MEQTWFLSTAIMHPHTYEYTHTFITGTEGHRCLNGTRWEEVFLQLTFSVLKSSWEPADGGLILPKEWVRRGRKRDLERVIRTLHMKSMCSLRHILQVEGRMDIDVALVPSSAKRWLSLNCHRRGKFTIHKHNKINYTYGYMQKIVMFSKQICWQKCILWTLTVTR